MTLPIKAGDPEILPKTAERTMVFSAVMQRGRAAPSLFSPPAKAACELATLR